MCEHKNFKAQVDVTRLTDEKDETKVNGYRADLTIHCMDCFMPFTFVGVPGGYTPAHPTTNFDATELRIPIKPV